MYRIVTFTIFSRAAFLVSGATYLVTVVCLLVGPSKSFFISKMSSDFRTPKPKICFRTF